jgi:hypothetical protein
MIAAAKRATSQSRTPFALVALLACAWTASSAHAATCVVQGTVRVESMDTYYCDPDILGTAACASWIETDLDDKSGSSAPPLKNALLLLSKDGALLSSAVTSATGAYSFSYQSVSCSQNNSVRVHVYFDRRDPADVGKGTFRLVDDSNLTLSTYRDFLLSGTPATRDITFSRGNSASLIAKAPTVYHTMNSAIDQVRTWSSNLAARFKGAPISDGSGAMRVRFSNTVTLTAATLPQWLIEVEPQEFSSGGTLRHELGHLIHYGLHHRNMQFDCDSYKLNTYVNDNHSAGSCEYGHMASGEGLASFFAARSILTNDGNNAFFCQCWWRDEELAGATPVQDICSNLANGSMKRAVDRRVSCSVGGGGPVVGLGDDFANTTDHCIRLSAGLSNGRSGKGCACPDLNFDGKCDFSANVPQICPDANSDGTCDTFVAQGFRNEWNIARFMWDVLDNNSENGQDDTDRSIQSLVLNFESMPCTGSSGRGQDGDCNESNPLPAACRPSYDGDLVVGSMTGTRDAYNPSDFEKLIPNDQAAERAINCVSQAN